MAKKRTPPAGKLLCLDVETTSLDANRGHMLCAVAKWVGKPELFKFRIDETPGYGKTPASFFNDSAIVSGLTPLLETADAVLAYYGSGFDIPYITTRAFANRSTPPLPVTVLDPWKTARSCLRLQRNSLEQVGQLLGTRRQKTHVDYKVWQLAQYGDSRALTTLLDYNCNDVVMLEDVYYELRPIIKNHPYLGDAVATSASGRCPSCGSGRSKNHGGRNTRCFRVFRRRCLECGTAYETHRVKLQ